MVEQFLFWILTLFCLSYATLHFFLWKVLSRLLSPKLNDNLQSISVIVAARNEEKNISHLLRSISELEYPLDKFEVIIVNDRSTDSTSAIVETFSQQHFNVRLVTIYSNTSAMPNKKNALSIAITLAKFDLLAFTDADCIVPKKWLREISNHYTEDVGTVAGHSPYSSEHLNSFLRYEENKNSLIAASAIELKNAFMSTGRNFSYRKQVFEQLNGFEQIKQSISGDDDLFIQLVQHKTEWKIRYMVSSESYVRTVPPSSFSQFVNQRTRHVSASKYYPKKIQTAYALIHLFHLSITVGLFISPLAALIFLMIKFNIDGLFITSGERIFHEKFSLLEFAVNEVLLVLYSFFIAPLGLILKFDWKGTSNS
jgi:biofilm PGA synthesis N-glycosyltransferase PgaC